VVARDVDDARARAPVGLTPLATFGAGILRERGSPPCSANVFRNLEAGSGTAGVSDLFGSICTARGSLQPDGLCFAGGGIVLRAFVPDSGNSLSAREGEVMWERFDGGLIPERCFIMPCNGR
jgi:hypothetical protein